MLRAQTHSPMRLSAFALVFALVAVVAAQSPDDAIAQWQACLADGYPRTTVSSRGFVLERAFPAETEACLRSVTAVVPVHLVIEPSALQVASQDTLRQVAARGLHRTGYTFDLHEEARASRSAGTYDEGYTLVLSGEPGEGDEAPVFAVEFRGPGGASGGGTNTYSGSRAVARVEALTSIVQGQFTRFAGDNGWISWVDLVLAQERRHPPGLPAITSQVTPGMRALYRAWEAQAEAAAQRTSCSIYVTPGALSMLISAPNDTRPEVGWPVALGLTTRDANGNTVTVDPDGVREALLEEYPSPYLGDAWITEDAVADALIPPLDVSDLVEPGMRVAALSGEGLDRRAMLRNAVKRHLDTYLPLRYDQMRTRAQWEACLYRSAADVTH